MQIKPNI